MFELEKGYWWHIGRKKLVSELIKRHFGNHRISILDFGCGTGATMQSLESHGEVIGVDTSREAINFCTARGMTNAIKISAQSGLKRSIKRKFDLITALDVIEHIKDDQKTLMELGSLLKEKGSIIITVPAYPFLWSYWDEYAHHKRRYTARSLRKLLEKSGFKVVKLSYFYSFILPAVMLMRIAKSKSRPGRNSDFVKFPKAINSLMIRISGIERQLLKSFRIPFGLSVVCLAEKV